jgi:hypothetical protein
MAAPLDWLREKLDFCEEEISNLEVAADVIRGLIKQALEELKELEEFDADLMKIPAREGETPPAQPRKSHKRGPNKYTKAHPCPGPRVAYKADSDTCLRILSELETFDQDGATAKVLAERLSMARGTVSSCLTALKSQECVIHASPVWFAKP